MDTGRVRNLSEGHCSDQEEECWTLGRQHLGEGMLVMHKGTGAYQRRRLLNVN